jgi:hypothetical protein
MKEFTYDGNLYKIDDSKKVSGMGDFDENNKIIYVDKEVPEKFHEGIAVHEIEERKLIKKGHSYVFSHNEAQKIELAFYEKKFGIDKSMKMLEEEERVVLTLDPSRSVTRTKRPKDLMIPAPIIESVWIRQITYDNKKYLIDNSNRLVGAIVDLYEKKNVLYIDCDVPERFFEGLAIFEIETRKMLKKGLSYNQSYEEAGKKEQAFYESKFGKDITQKMLADEAKLQVRKFSAEKKELGQDSGHKVIYDKGEILPK